MRSIILAGGNATRLPNKLMLHTLDGCPLIHSSIQFAITNTSHVRMVVQSEQDPHARYADGCVELVVIPEPKGVMNALQQAWYDGEDHLILFGDCCDYFGQLPKVMNEASVSEIGHDQLDGWDGRVWRHRSYNPKYKFCGWIVTNRKPKGLNILAWMNDVGIKPYVLSKPIVDLGTQESYRRHWNG